MAKFPLVPNIGKCIVKPDEAPKQTPGGLHLPDTARQDRRTARGKIVAVGAEERTTDQMYRVELKVGQACYFSTYSGTEIELGEEKYLVLGHGDVLATCEEN